MACDSVLPRRNRAKSPAHQGKHGDTTYYFFETQDLPLFGPLRTLGVPEPVIDVVEPFFKVIVDLGYDRSIPAWEPTPERLIPPLHPATVAGDLVDAIGAGITNAEALIGTPAPLSSPAGAVTADHDFAAPQRPVDRGVATIRNRLDAAIGAVKSVRSGGDNGSDARSEVKKVVTKVSDNIKKALSGGKGDETKDESEGGSQ
jgi:hypothetical protein